MIDSLETRSVQGLIHTLGMLGTKGDKGELRIAWRDGQDTRRQQLSP